MDNFFRLSVLNLGIKVLIACMKNFLLSSFAFSLLFPSLHAQEEIKTENSKKLKFSDFSLYQNSEFFLRETAFTTLDAFQKISPSNELIPQDLTRFFHIKGGDRREQIGFSLIAGFDFQEKGKRKFFANKSLRFGLFYNNQNYLSSYYNVRFRSPYGFATVMGTGETFPLDSISIHGYGFEYFSQQLGLESSLLFKSRDERRFKFYVGIGITAAKSFTATTKAYYGFQGTIEFRDLNDGPYHPGNTSARKIVREQEDSKASGNTSFAAFIPAGVDFTIGKRSKWLKRAHVFYEFRGGVFTTIISDYGAVNGTLLSGGFGIRYSLN